MLTLVQNIISVKINCFSFQERPFPLKCFYVLSGHFKGMPSKGGEKAICYGHFESDKHSSVQEDHWKSEPSSEDVEVQVKFRKQLISPLEAAPFTAVIETATGKDDHLGRAFQYDTGQSNSNRSHLPKTLKHYLKFKYSPIRCSFKGTQYLSNNCNRENNYPSSVYLHK